MGFLVTPQRSRPVRGSRPVQARDTRGKDTTMSELLVDFISSLDGYASAEGWPGYWGLEGPEYLGWLEQSPERDYTVLMGATTYRLMAQFAADIPDEPAFEALGAMRKLVFSSTLEEPLPWSNSELAHGDAAEVVRKMKRD